MILCEKTLNCKAINDNKHYDIRHEFWQASAMEKEKVFFEDLKNAIRASGKSQAEIFRQTGVQQASISRFLNDDQNLSSDNAIKITYFLGGKIHFPKSSDAPTIRRTGSNSPSESVTGESLPTVPVYGSTGAGEPTELFSGEPEMFLQVLPQYMRPGMGAFMVDGDSMEPTIKRGAYVGVVEFAGDFSEGGIYLVHVPHFGRVIKRIRMSANGAIMLHSDNAAYDPMPLPHEDCDKSVLGKVVWVWQGV